MGKPNTTNYIILSHRYKYISYYLFYDYVHTLINAFERIKIYIIK